MQSNSYPIRLSADSLDNLLLDLGGVLVKIDFQRMARAFETLGFPHLHEMYNHQQQMELFDRFDRGQISEDDFRRELFLNIAGKSITAEQFDEAWNKIIVDVSAEVLRCLERLSRHFNLFLLSNTNSIHIRYLYQLLQQERGVQNFEAYFRKVYYSYKMGCRKPERVIFEQVIADATLVPSRTLFVDDTLANIETAQQLGFQVFLMPAGKLLSDVILCK
ncbi:MAG: HAD family hydrolase [Bacteroidales bacterium]